MTGTERVHYPPAEELRPAVFLDRDGTIIEEKFYLSQPDEVVLLPTVGEAIAALNNSGHLVVVVTNQAGVARGLFTEQDVDAVHRRLDRLLQEHGAKVDMYVSCPHHPTAGIGKWRIECNCRKPRPGMILHARDALEIDLQRSYMVGDKLTDLQAGDNAGCSAILVLTGYGRAVWADLQQHGSSPYSVAPTLLDAVKIVLAPPKG